MKTAFDATYLFGTKGLGLTSLADPNLAEGKSQNARALCCGNWNIRPLEVPFSPSRLVCDQGIYVTDKRDVLIFKAPVPSEGIYQVTFSVTADQPVENMALFTGRRGKIRRNISLDAGETFTVTFYTRIAPYIPAMEAAPACDLFVTLSVTGKNAGLSSVIIKEVTEDIPATVWIGGDSTLTDQNAGIPYYLADSCSGWAQVLAQYLPHNPVYNLAHSGLTSNCFRQDGHYAIALERLRPGDIFLFQFGHNDQKRRNLSAYGGYAANLRRFVQEVREKGAFPVLISPISRIPLIDQGRFVSLLKAHADAASSVAEELSVPFIDLHALTFSFLTKHFNSASDYFMPGDITHTNEYGAEVFARLLVREILLQPDNPLHAITCCKRLPRLLPDMAEKNAPRALPLPVKLPLPYVDLGSIPQLPALKKAMEYGLLDPCVLHLHPKDPLPRAQFLMVYLRCLRLDAIRPYEGAFSDIARFEWDAGYVETCIREHLIDPDTVSDTHYRPDDPLLAEEYASFLIRGMAPFSERDALTLSECYKKSLREGFLPEGIQPKEVICRADIYAGLVALMEKLNTKSRALPKDAEVHPVG